jgi:Uma2 family endonuclease
MSAPAFKPMSVEEYLRTEELSPYKREYVGGYVYPLHGSTRAQAGTSRGHVRIGLNIVRALDEAVLERGCSMYASDMKLRVQGIDNFYYPDVMVVCGQDDGNLDAVYETNPCLLVEVLSRSTAKIDRTAKQVAYTSIPSLRTYLIAEQTKRKVIVYQRGTGGWINSELTGEGGVDLPYLGLTLTLGQIYRALPI